MLNPNVSDSALYTGSDKHRPWSLFMRRSGGSASCMCIRKTVLGRQGRIIRANGACALPKADTIGIDANVQYRHDFFFSRFYCAETVSGPANRPLEIPIWLFSRSRGRGAQPVLPMARYRLSC